MGSADSLRIGTGKLALANRHWEYRLRISVNSLQRQPVARPSPGEIFSDSVDRVTTSVIIIVTTTVVIQERGATVDANISDAEWQVMEAAWSLGEAPAAAIIEELAKSTAWNHRTIRTLLGRLVEKGV